MKEGITVFRVNVLKLYLGHKSFISHVFSNFYLRLGNSDLYILGIVGNIFWSVSETGKVAETLCLSVHRSDKVIGPTLLA